MLNSKKTYQELLNTPEWKAKRESVIKRDFYRCQICMGEEPISEFNDELGCQVYYRLKFGEVVQDGDTEYQIITNEYLSESFFLHVHHKYYVRHTAPWDYPNDALITLCGNCHAHLHKTEKVPFYKNSLQTRKLHLTSCLKCDGAGYLPEYSYWKAGVCFKCNGNRYYEFVQ